MGLECSGVYQQSFTFWSVTLQPLGAYRYTIPHMKEDIHSFHMRYISMICYKRLQSNGLHTSLSACPLVSKTERETIMTSVTLSQRRSGGGLSFYEFVEGSLQFEVQISVGGARCSLYL